MEKLDQTALEALADKVFIPARVAAMLTELKQRIAGDEPFSKEYLQLLVKEIVLNGNSVKIGGGYASLAGAIKFAAQKKKLSTPGEVLNFNSVWRPLADALRTFPVS